jgi:hypothetical protein
MLLGLPARTISGQKRQTVIDRQQQQMSIAKKIVETLGAPRDPWSRAEVEAGVLQDIDTLRVVAKMISRDAMHKAVDDARDLIKAIKKLQEKLRSATLSPYLVTRIELACPRLLDETERLRAECRHVESDAVSPCSLSRLNQLKYRSAFYAYELMLRYSKAAPSNGSSNAPFRVITGLLYSAIQPGDAPDLRHACAAVLRAVAIGH